MVRKRDASAACVRAFALLEALAAEDGPVPLADLAARVRLPKATVHRLLAQLAGAGLVGREPERRRFAVGARFSALALRVLANSTHRGVRRAILQGLVDDLGETCNLTMLDGAEIVYLDRVDTPSPLRVNLQPGSKVPLHCTASGKLLLALLPAARRQRLVAQLHLERPTPNTLGTRAALETHLKRVRRERLGIDAEEFITGLVCVAVPIPAADGRAIGAVAMQAPVARMPLERAVAHAPRLREAATALAATFA
ncbi:MAG TPA: IclR family transcriptional regulator [Burkholderiales bacterium]|jgi:DNA-binding IclR family transcriptional regulator|nr:IclR family transcriptional regulator [Burkholderiales bacterium]